ncbi:MAG TPA: hypothetical protein O0X14_02745, partial [Methanocorpusculum sp.]|nr:hypothetical protein [Methanocorpusculum sp.]
MSEYFNNNIGLTSTLPHPIALEIHKKYIKSSKIDDKLVTETNNLFSQYLCKFMGGSPNNNFNINTTCGFESNLQTIKVLKNNKSTNTGTA